MSRDEFYAAVLAFLDQFIARGAAPDILELRAQLASAPAARLLLSGTTGLRQSSEHERRSGDIPERWPRRRY
jgi:hypothetical protein